MKRTRKKKLKEAKIERQEIYCHACGQYVQFDIDLSLNGNHTLECPNCGHEHYRVVRNGKITEDRWQNSGAVYSIPTATITYTATSTYSTYNSVSTGATDGTSAYFYDSWINTATSYN